ncbi:alpha/beta fold hydrolase [Tenacibaculum jejuense]|uniref:Alpha/beta hydrolase n=1 Tax=Tenacibaculum jejuense TaxID=584609 RepID=A0A238U5Z2_9FLAO|nr:alpha/beta fold hydrolase [Tenacibaculum jejuense]SNR14522.1 Alpha/beta hydrolase [Tenacibaculum jejuense]
MSEILHSKIVGEGKPLLILHGFFGMGDNWKSHANKFAEDGFQVHLIDQRNHGRSFHSDEFSYELLVEDLLNYIQAHTLENVYLLGHSMGGKTAMLFATEHPEFIHKLIIADIAPKEYPPHHQDIIKALESVDFQIQNSRRLIDEKLSELISEVGVRQFILKNTYRKTKDQLAFRFNLKALSENYHEVVKPLPSSTVFNGETLFLRGEKSGYILDEDSFLIKAHFPNSEVETISKAGHWLHAENPSEFYTKAINFLK